MAIPKLTGTSAEEGDSFISHLVELRSRLVKAAIAVVVIFACLMPFASHIYDIMAMPMLSALPEGTKMIATGVITPFLVPIKVTLLVAFVLALPVVLYQMWAFVAPGLYAHEKKLALPIISSSFILFLIGVAFCYFFVFGTVFRVINEFAPKSVLVAPDIDAYFGFVMTMFIAFGVTFEVPIVVVVLVRFGIVSVETLRGIRPYIIVASFVIAAIITPPDPGSMMLLAVPLVVLYEAGLLVARFVRVSNRQTEGVATS
ncbi:MAG: twin-arginine translocase subunit TatC [Burkholderiaceae bacterium]